MPPIKLPRRPLLTVIGLVNYENEIFLCTYLGLKLLNINIKYDKYKNAGYLPAIQMSMIEDRVLTQILNSKIKEA